MATVDQVIGQLKQVSTRSYGVKMSVKGDPSDFARRVRKRWNPKRLSSLMEDFLMNHFMKRVMFPEFDKRAADPASLPDLIPNPYKSQDYMDRVGDTDNIESGANRKNMLGGFQEIKTIFMQSGKLQTGGYAGAGTGPTGSLATAQAWRHMPIPKAPRRSRLTNLWLTVEFGTGTADKLGGPGGSAPQFVITRGSGGSGRTKDDLEGNFVGAWWFPRIGRGVYSAGQQAFHWLHEIRGGARVISDNYTGQLQQGLKSYLQDRL